MALNTKTTQKGGTSKAAVDTAAKEDIVKRDAALREPAGVAAATEFSPSGAPRQMTEFDPAHPAIDNDPRANTTVLQNRADFNDPTMDQAEAVAENLNKQGVETTTEAAPAPAQKPAS